jgi:hypothetical protein
LKRHVVAFEIPRPRRRSRGVGRRGPARRRETRVPTLDAAPRRAGRAARRDPRRRRAFAMRAPRIE